MGRVYDATISIFEDVRRQHLISVGSKVDLVGDVKAQQIFRERSVECPVRSSDPPLTRIPIYNTQ